MRALRLPLLLLTVLLLLALFCSQRTGNLFQTWRKDLSAIGQASEAENWPDARQRLEDLQQQWQQEQTWLRITLPHGDLEDVEVLLQRSLLHARAEDGAALPAVLSDLACQLEHLAEAEKFSLENIW